ncbi:Long-chain-fatty-acid--CoA ligase [Rhynchospora pubera]|uniref:4-coumarate--CoA ligase n=1 Tax=Rhynchospora pubera TaxID=906938 RepID=A0AAV8AJX9_9POAL|nr:Long-chain-fatty-acid--CoA ligase [Rhynchospora pubera]
MAIQLSSAMSSVHHHRTSSLRLLGSRSGTPWTIPMICSPVRCSRHGATRCSLEVGEKVRRKCSPFLEKERKNVTNETNNNTPNYWKAIPDIWRSNAEKFGDRIALVDTYHDPPSKLTHNQVEQEILNFAEGLRQIGLVPEEKVALFADNSCRWLIADQGIMATGAINAVRGTRSSDEELFKIYTHSESSTLGEKSSLSNNSAIKGISLYDYNEITQLGQEYRTKLSVSPKTGQSQDLDTIKPDDIATLMYTSGTSGMPKGVMLTHQNLFHQAIGVTVQNGYGLTETSPVVAIRDPNCNVLGTIGPPLKYTEVKVVDKETGLTVPDGSKGILKFRGPQVMKGYYKNTTATEAAVDKDGWFNTGDVGWIVPKHTMGRSHKAGGMIVVVGRVKDTIVLSTGENVDPKDLEEAALNSRFIHQIMVVGQDQRRLGAIIVPNKDDKMEMPKEKLLNLLYDEVRTWTASCSFQIGPILIVDEPFTVDNGLVTPTMKVKRDAVTAKYQNQIANMYK